MKRSSFITWDQLKVGALIVVALVILAIAILKLGQAGNLFGKRYRLVSLVGNASGLRVGGPVTVAGQLAGSIKDIKFLPPDTDTTRNLKLIVEVNSSLQQQIRQDSRAKIKTQGLLGDKVYDITVGTPKYRPLREGETLVVAPALDVTEFVFEHLFGPVFHRFEKYLGADERDVVRLERESVVRDEIHSVLAHQDVPHVFVADHHNFPVRGIGQMADDQSRGTNGEAASRDGLGARRDHSCGKSGSKPHCC